MARICHFTVKGQINWSERSACASGANVVAIINGVIGRAECVRSPDCVANVSGHY